MSLIQVFNTLMLGQGPATMYGPGDYINDVKERRYVVGKHLSMGTSKHIEGGSILQDIIFLEGESQHIDYNPASLDVELGNPQPGTKITADWRFTLGAITWDNVEIMLNVGKSYSRAHNVAKFKDVHDMKHLNYATTRAAHFENQMWARPDASEMEVGSSGTAPQSLPVFINEWSDVDLAVAGTGTDITGHFPGYTTVQGVDPGTKVKWQNAKETYGEVGTDSGASGANQHLFSAFDRMVNKTEFDQLPMDARWTGPRDRPAYIACSLDGHTQITSAYRVNQDWFRWKGNDAYQNNPTFAGIEICYISALDTAALYSTVSASTTYLPENSASLDGAGATDPGIGEQGARYYFVNAQHIPKVFHSERYLVKEEPRNPKGTMPFSWWMPVDTWHQLWCRSRRTSGIVSPTAALTA